MKSVTTPVWFGAESFVTMADGTLEQIQYISVGRTVLSIDSGTNVVDSRRVTATAIHDAEPTLDIYYRVETDQELPLETTPESPFWVDGNRWVLARNLVAGDNIATTSGRPAVVECVIRTGYSINVHSIEVEDGSAFVVGSQGLLIFQRPNG